MCSCKYTHVISKMKCWQLLKKYLVKLKDDTTMRLKNKPIIGGQNAFFK